jgi:type II secretory pathway component PulJ
MNRRLKAFTLFELVIGMLLSAVVIGMVYSGYGIIVKIYDKHLITSRAQSELMMMEATLQRDLDEAVTVQADGQRIQMMDSLGSPAVSYLVSENQLIRNSSLADTFRLDQLTVSFCFESAEVQRGLTDQLNMKFSFSEKAQGITIHKKYSAQQLFNQK